jgi:hypothetical protein
MTPSSRPTRPLEVWPCQSICVWSPSDEVWLDPAAGALRVFRCSGCGSEWVRTEAWTPVDAVGRVPPQVVAERDVG